MKKFFFLFYIFLFNILFSNVITVSHNGNDDFSSITEAMDFANEADTVLVKPDIYYENLHFKGKNITVGSLFLLTQNPDFIRETIIDGNYSESCAVFDSSETRNAVLCGFTLQHGSGHYGYLSNNQFSNGGGIYIYDSSPTITDCIIEHNISYSGGGILVVGTYETGYANPFLENCTIRYNNASDCSGGLAISYSSKVTFNPEKPCNIYLNYSGFRSDLFMMGDYPTTAYIDTFTVALPDSEYFYKIKEYDTLFINTGYLIPTDSDLYVAPWGDNNNEGTSPNSPLKTIVFAYSKIKSNPNCPHTIHLAAGEYSESSNGEKSTLCARSYVSLVGENRDNTLIKCEGDYDFFHSLAAQHHYSIENISFTNTVSSVLGMSSFWISQPVGLHLKNLRLFDITNLNGQILTITYSRPELEHIHSSVRAENIIIENNNSVCAGSFSMIDTVWVNNFKIVNNQPNYGYEVVTGGSYIFGGYYDDSQRCKMEIYNSLFANNRDACTQWSNCSSAIDFVSLKRGYLVNCTVVNNTSITGAAIVLRDQSKIDIINSIIYGNNPYQIMCVSDYMNNPNTLNIDHSCIENGEWGIAVVGNNQVNYGNNMPDNPEFSNEDENPFALSSTSPCIDAGTTDLLDSLSIPPTDLAGNERIMGNNIDIGAYEYDPIQSNQDDQIPENLKSILKVYPNPFRISQNKKSITLSLEINKSDNVNLSVYNLKGQLVKTIVDAYLSTGSYKYYWNLKNEDGKKISTGLYIAKFYRKHRLTKFLKFTIVK